MGISVPARTTKGPNRYTSPPRLDGTQAACQKLEKPPENDHQQMHRLTDSHNTPGDCCCLIQSSSMTRFELFVGFDFPTGNRRHSSCSLSCWQTPVSGAAHPPPFLRDDGRSARQCRQHIYGLHYILSESGQTATANRNPPEVNSIWQHRLGQFCWGTGRAGGSVVSGVARRPSTDNGRAPTCKPAEGWCRCLVACIRG